jgi:hypothetical protein
LDHCRKLLTKFCQVLAARRTSGTTQQKPFEFGVGNINNYSLRECQTNSFIGFSATSTWVNEARLPDFIFFAKSLRLARLRRRRHEAERRLSPDLRTYVEFISNSEGDPMQAFYFKFAKPHR